MRRLLVSAKRHRVSVTKLIDSVRAYDIDDASVVRTKSAVLGLLADHGVDRGAAETIVAQWIHRADFLLTTIDGHFDVVVGNPPYVRIEQLDPRLQAIYRGRFETIFDRADLYVAFIERSLELLSGNGLLSFICADRWTMNRYGAPLRSLIAREYGVRVYVDLHQASPFESDVIAYPSIFVFERTKPNSVTFARLRDGSADECAALAAHMDSMSVISTHDGVHLFRYERWFENDDPWVLGSPEQLAALRELEDRFATLEADGQTRVGIGVATGADEVFIVSDETVPRVEPDRLVPLVMRSDIREGRIEWSGRYVINTFSQNGGGVDLSDYPKLAAYFAEHDAAVRRRHVSQRSNGFWFARSIGFILNSSRSRSSSSPISRDQTRSHTTTESITLITICTS
ncbi:MAG: Eco57I restriction-modification methylase domain-containing protein [Acidobacteriota bacterium]